MPRYEFKDGKSNKFWEIELEEESFTTRWGRIGTDGQETTKEYDSKADARKEYDKLVAEKVKKGYVLVDAGGGPTPSKRNPELEAAILRDLDSDDGFLVYGDWLQANGDPRGELVAIQGAIAAGKADAALRAKEAELLAQARENDFGAAAELVSDDAEATVHASYRLGFVSDVSIGFHDWDAYEEHNADLDFGDVVARLLKSPGGAFVRSLRIGLTSLEGDTDWSETVRSISKAGPYAPLRSLVIGDFEYPEQSEISWANVGDVGKAFATFPRLERIEVQGGGIGLGKVDAPELRHLELRTGGLPAGALKSITKGKLPLLETLVVWTGDRNYGADSTIDDVRPILDGANLPALTHLGIMNCEYTDEVAAALPKSKLLPRLKVLDLSMGTLSDEGAQHLLNNRESFAHLERLELGENFLTEATLGQLRAWPNVNASAAQREPYDWDEGRRYVSIGE